MITAHNTCFPNFLTRIGRVCGLVLYTLYTTDVEDGENPIGWWEVFRSGQQSPSGTAGRLCA